jgi:hypothetical protein
METSHIVKIMQLALKQDPRPLERLVKGKPYAAGKKAVEALTKRDMKDAKDPQSLPLVQAVLYLCFDCFEEAHNIANEHEDTVIGNWLHAILHRREPDAGNSKYWYARVKAPAKVFEAIGKEVLSILKEKPVAELEPLVKKLEMSKTWEPEIFVDLCNEYREKDPDSPTYQTLARIQEIEWRGLAEYILTA